MEYAGNTLSRLDTGIIGLEGERVDMDVLPKDAELRKRLAELDENELITIIAERAAGDYELEVFAVHAGEDRPVAGRMRTPHMGPDKKGHGFGLGMGSSGTKRLMGLLPMPFDLRDEAAPAKPEVYVADGPDRCLRAMLAMRLMGGFLGGRGETARRQLILATHGLLPVGQPLMRRDEMYIAQRKIDGRSVPVGLAEFKEIRFDKDLIRSYLDGRFGGIPTAGKAGSRG